MRNTGKPPDPYNIVNMKKAPQRLTAGEVDIRRLLRKLDFQDTEIVAAAQEQGLLFFEASKLRSQKYRLRMNREAAVDLVKSEVLLAEKAALIEAGESFTMGSLHARVVVNPEYQKATRRLRMAIEEEEAAKLLLDAFKHRRDALKVVLEQNRAELGIGSINLKGLREQLYQKYPGMEK